MKICLVFLLLILTIFSCQESDSFIVKYNEFVDSRNQSSKIAYEISYKGKSFNSSDFTVREAKVYIEKNVMDSIFGARFILDMDSCIYVYNGINLFQLLNENVIKVDVQKYPDAFINTNIEKDLLMRSFIGNSDILDLPRQDSSIILDTLVINRNGEEFLSIALNFTDNEDFSNQKLICEINLESNILALFDYQVEYMDSKQISISKIKRLHFDESYYSKYMNAQFLKNAKTVSDYRIDEKGEIDVVGQVVELTGINYKTRDSFAIVKDKSEFKVLDFYFSACFPCIKSVEEINEIILSNEFSNVSFYGLNYIDNNVRKNADIDKFVKQHKMQYPTILVEGDVVIKCQAQAYPTVLILNKENKILYHHVGFNGKLSEALNSLMK